MRPLREQARSHMRIIVEHKAMFNEITVGASLLAKAASRAIYPYAQIFRQQNRKHYLLYLYTKA
jgi:hypothetical protein